MKYYKLYCIRCKIAFEAIVATLPGQILACDIDELNIHFRDYIVSDYEKFYRVHRSHGLDEMQVE